MSKPTYRYENSFKFVKKGISHTVKEQVIDGPKGLTIMFLKKIGDKESTRQIDEKALIQMLKSKKLDGVINYIIKERGTYK